MELTPPINPEIKELWCSALESGEYLKARDRLRTDNGFCCLGVLGDLAVKAGVAEWINDGSGYGIRSAGSFSTTSVITDIRHWAELKGLHADDPIVQIEHKDYSLSHLNDTGYDFKTIAQIIREQL